MRNRRYAGGARRFRGTPVLLTILLVALVGGGVLGALAANNRQDDERGASGVSGTPSHPSASAHATPSQPQASSSSPLPPTPAPIPGYLMIADRGNDRIMLVDSQKRVLWGYPKPGSTPAMPFHFDDDVFFGPVPHEVISQQEDQQTIQIMSFPQGRLLWRYGHVNIPGSGPGFLSTPDDAYLLPGGTVSVADVGNCRILFISPAHRVIRQLGTTGVCAHDPPRAFASPNGDTPLPGGGTLVTEINGSYVDAISSTGKLEWTVHAPVGYPSDAQWLGDGRILLSDYSSPGHVLIMNSSGRVLWEYGPASGSGALNHPSLAIMLPNGLIAVNDDYRDRVVLIDPHRNRIVWQFGHTDVGGTAPGFLHTPDGLDFLPYATAMQDPLIRAAVLPAGR